MERQAPRRNSVRMAITCKEIYRSFGHDHGRRVKLLVTVWSSQFCQLEARQQVR
jgi:hypothetical protein